MSSLKVKGFFVFFIHVGKLFKPKLKFFMFSNETKKKQNNVNDYSNQN